MKILSWNVNGLGARVEAIRRLSQELCPDVMCFQKERAKNSGSLIDEPGYIGLFCTVERPQMLFGGVATFLRRDPEFELGRLFRHVDGWIGETGNIQTFIALIRRACARTYARGKIFRVPPIFPPGGEKKKSCAKKEKSRAEKNRHDSQDKDRCHGAELTFAANSKFYRNEKIIHALAEKKTCQESFRR